MRKAWSNRSHLGKDYNRNRFENGYGKSYYEVAKRDRKTGRVTVKDWIEY